MCVCVSQFNGTSFKRERDGGGLGETDELAGLTIKLVQYLGNCTG